MTRPVRRHLSRRTRLVCAASAAAIVWALAGAAAALPTGGVVYDSTPGSPTTFTPGSGTLDINQGGERVVIDWTTFDIASGETVTFNQGGADWIAFNRVNPSNLSTIDGNLNATGQVWLFSPGGLLFGPNAQVNTGSFVGSTAQLLDGDVAAALTTDSVTLSPLALANGADLTVSSGASINADSGFVVLLGETIVQNGTIVSDNDAVWYGVAQGGQVNFTSNPGLGPDLNESTVAGVAGQQPSLTQGSTGVTTAGTWVGVSTPSTTASGWSTSINLGGSIQASGAQPGGPGVIIITGDDGTMDLTTPDVHVDTSAGTITSVEDVYISATTITTGDIYGDRFVILTSGGDTTVDGAITSVEGTYLFSDGGITISATGSIDSDYHVGLYATEPGGDIDVQGDLTSAYTVSLFADDQITVGGTIDADNSIGIYSDGAVLIEATGYLHSGGSGSPGIIIAAATDLTVEAGAQVLATDDIDLTSDGTMTLDGYFHGLEVDALSDGQMDVGGDLYGDAYVMLETTTGDLLLQTGASIDTNGFGGAVPVRLTSGGSLSIADGVTVDSYDDMAIRADGGDLTIDGYIYGDRVDLDATGDLTIGSTGYFYINQFSAEAVGDILIDGFIDAPTTLFATSSGGDITIGANANLSSFSVGLVAADQLTTVAGSSIDGDGGVGTLSFTAHGADGADSAMELSGDIDGQNVQIVATVGSVTIHGGTITAANDINTYVEGDFTIGASALIDAGGDVSITPDGDLTIAGEVRADILTLLGNTVDTAAGYLRPDTALYVTGGYVTLGDVQLSNGLIDVSAADSLDITGFWATPYSDIYLTLLTNAALGDVTLSSSIYASTITIDSAGGITLTDDADINVRTYVNTGINDVSAAFTAVGDLTIAAGAELDARGMIELTTTGAGGDISVDGFVRGTYFTFDSAGAMTLDASFNFYTLDGDAVGDITVNDGATFGYQPSIDLLTTTGDINFDADFGGRSLFLTADAGLVTIGATADIEAGQLAAGAVLQINGYDGVTIENGASVVSQSDMQIFGSGTDAVVTIDGYVHGYGTGSNNAFAVVVGSQSELDIGATGSVLSEETLIISGLDLTIDGQVQATDNLLLRAYTGGDIAIGATADLQGDFVDIQAEGDITIAGDIYAYEASIIADGNVTQSGGTITVDDGGLYIYALYDVTTEAGALIQTTIDGGGAIIYLNAGDDLTVGGDIDGGYFVNLNSEANDLDSTVTISGSIYATDFIIVYNQYGDIHLTGTAELFAGQPTVFTDPGIFIAAEGSILSDAGSFIHTYAGYAEGYVHIESNHVTGSIDLSGDITSENVTIEAPFGVVDIFLRDGTISTSSDFYIDSNGDLLVGANLYADYVTLEAQGDVTVSGDIVANDSVSVTSTGGDVYIDGFIEAYASSGTAILVSAEGDLTIAAGGDLEAYGDLVLQTTGPGGVLEVSGDILGDNVYLSAQGGILVGATADIYAYDLLQLVSDDGLGGATAADIQIDGIMDGNGVSIINRNDGDVIFGATADVSSYYFICTYCRTDPGGETALLGLDGDIYIYSANSVITVAGSQIDATAGAGADQGLITIVANGPDIGASVTTAAIDLSGDITAYNVVLTANNGSIRQREGTITFTEDFTADADVSFIQDGGGVIDGLNGSSYGNVTVYANNNILLLGSIEGYYVELTTTGTVPGSEIQVAGEVYASDGITITNLDGDILVHSTGVIHTGTPFETSDPDITLVADGVITTEAGSQIYTDAAYSSGSQITLQSTLASGLGIDLAGDITTAGTVNIVTTVNADIGITGGSIDAGVDVNVRSQNQIDITGGSIEAGDTAQFRSDADMLLGGDVYADFIDASLYSGEGGGVYGSVLRVEGELTAQTDVRLRNPVGQVQIGATAVITGNFSGLADGGYSAVDIYGESVLTEYGSLITVGDGVNPPVGRIDIEAYYNFAGPGPAIDLSGDIEADELFIDAGAGNDMRIRNGDITAIAGLNFNIDGYFIVDDPASIETGGQFYARADGGVTFDGYLQADLTVTLQSGYADISIGGQINGYDQIVIGAAGDVMLGPDAVLWSDYDLSGPLTGVTIDAGGQLVTAAGSRIVVGQPGAATGDVHLSAHGGDFGGFSSLDLSGDIDAEHLYLYTEYASIRLRDGDIVLEEDLNISSPRGFLMNAAATIDTDGYVEISAVDQLAALGSITSGEYITLSSTGLSTGGMTVAGYLYADGDVTISSANAGADIILGGPTIIADADNSGTGEIDIDSAGAVVAPGNGLLQVGDGSGAPTGDVTIHAAGLDGPSTAAIDLNIDINAVTLTLDADAGSIHIGQGADFVLTDDFTVDSVLDFDMDYGAFVGVAGDIDITANRALTVDGHLDADGDVTLLAGAGGGDLSIAGLITAGADVDIRTHSGDIVIEGGDIYADAGLAIHAYGGFSSDDKSVIEAGGDLAVSAGGQMTVDGDLTALGDISLVLTGGGLGYGGYANFVAGPDDVVISGSLNANGSVYIDNASGGDIYLDPTAAVLANADDLGSGEFIDIFAYGQVVSADGSTIAVGTGPIASGDVNILAFGTDNADYSAIDLSGDINASVLTLTTTDGSIALNDGTFNGASGITISSADGFILEDGVVATTTGNFIANAQGDMVLDGYVDAGYNVLITRSGPGVADIIISGDLYAAANVDLVNNGAGGDIILNGATLVGDSDDFGSGSVQIVSNGQVHAYGGGLISSGPANDPTNLVSITANGTDGGGLSAIDLDIDISAATLLLYSDASIDIAGGQINVLNDLDIYAALNFTLGDPASIDGGGDINIVAGSTLVVDGDLTAAGDISLLLDGAFFTGFTPGPGDMTVGGAITANGSVSIVNQQGGDIYLEAAAAITADADSSLTGDRVEIEADGQVISAGGSSIIVGAAGAPTGDVSITANGGDNASYAAIDIASDIEALGLTLDAGLGSINLAGGQITVTEDLSIASALDFVMDEPANIDGEGDIDITAGRTFTVEGSIQADGDLTLLLAGPGALDMTIDQLMSAGGDMSIVNDGSGDLTLGAQTTLFAGGDITLQANGDVSTDGFIDAAELLTADAGGDMTFNADVQAGSGIVLIAGDDMAIGGYLIAEGYTDIIADAGGTLTQTGHLLNAGDILLYSGDDMALNGPIDSQGLLYAVSDGDISVAGTVQTGAIDLNAAGAIDLSGALTAASGDLDAQAGLGLNQSGSLAALGDIDLRSAATMEIDGSVIALDDISLTLQGGGDILISGDVIARDNIEIFNGSGDVRVYGGGDLVADVDGDGGSAVTLSIYASDRIFAADGSNMHVGSAVERTGVIDLYALAYDGEGGPAIELSGDMDAETIAVEAYNGSIVVSGSIQADESIELVAYHYFVLEDGGSVWGAMDRAVEDDLADGPILSDQSPGVGIVARDVSIDGEIRSGTQTDDATIVIAAHYVDGDVMVGGADAALGGDFNLSDAEFQNLYADRIVIIAGEGEPFGSGYDLHLADLTIDAANTSEVWFGTSENLFVNGVVSPSDPGEVDIHLGFTVLTDSILVDPGNPGALQPGEMLVDFIPNNVFISGSLGTAENPFGSVTMIVQGDILMGSQAFMEAAAADPEFDAAEESENFDPPAEDHVFIATDQLQMAAGDRILQQDTDTGTGYGGLVLGLPQPGFELIFSPDQLQGQLIGGTGGWTADFDAGPTRIELFGLFHGTPTAIDGRDAANVANLLDPDILLGDYYFNTCLFASSECSAGDETPPFIDPTPPVHPDPGVDPGVDEVLSFFTTFPFQEPEDEEDENEVEGEPVTGSGNEDLWTIKPTQGARP